MTKVFGDDGGGITPGTPDLQAVTTQGNTTKQPIIITDSDDEEKIRLSAGDGEGISDSLEFVGGGALQQSPDQMELSSNTQLNLGSPIGIGLATGGQVVVNPGNGVVINGGVVKLS